MLKLTVVAASLALAAVSPSGCSEPPPAASLAQIELYIPQSVLTCPLAPKSPGASANKQQVAAYITKLYAIYEECGGNIKTARTLYNQWLAKVKATKAKKRYG